MDGTVNIQSGLPIAIIGAGPVGLAAAAHLAERGLPFAIFEAGSEAGAAIRSWGHVRVFSPWRYNIDAASRRLLERAGWSAPDEDALPTGDEIVNRYVMPLAETDTIRPYLRFRAEVVSVGRKDFDKVRTEGRDAQPFELRFADDRVFEARAVIDASGTWRAPNPIGAGGYPVPGEIECAAHIAYGIPDVLGRDRMRFAGKRTLVVGSGHSAINIVLDLLTLRQSDPRTAVVWAMRREDVSGVFGGGAADALPARGQLGARARTAIDAGDVELQTPFRVREIVERNGALHVSGALRDESVTVEVDEIAAATGFRPQLDMLREIRLGLDPWLEATAALAPLVDPNLHSCGTVPPHGARELAHPEKDFFIVGMKSYGRAPTFLMTTGYEQVRSVAALLSGDHAAAERIELNLPETGVCSTPASAESCCGTPTPAETAAASCCGGPVPAGTDACCAEDAVAKEAGESGCGCTDTAKKVSA